MNIKQIKNVLIIRNSGSQTSCESFNLVSCYSCKLHQKNKTNLKIFWYTLSQKSLDHLLSSFYWNKFSLLNTGSYKYSLWSYKLETFCIHNDYFMLFVGHWICHAHHIRPIIWTRGQVFLWQWLDVHIGHGICHIHLYTDQWSSFYMAMTWCPTRTWKTSHASTCLKST